MSRTTRRQIHETTSTSYRMPSVLLDRVDKYRDRLAREHPGMRTTRADAVRMLIEKGLEAVEVR